jgi:ribonuclease E
LRVAIVDGQKLIDIEIESAGREQRKGNIYKALVTRVEPGLEACFVNYGEDRHGFLPFKEISRSYFKPGTEVGRARINEAIAEGQMIIVQVEKEERGNKGAALTSFISLAGRYLVLMPNNPRGGGVSRRVEGDERQELKEAMEQLTVPPGMSLIARTAGIGRSAVELQWDLNYLLQLWSAIERASQEMGPNEFLIYQESLLVIRAIRDYFSSDINEILIDTQAIYDQVSNFMRTVMPDMVDRLKLYTDDVPLFSRFQIEPQIETAYSRNVPLPSGGSIVIDHTEALVAVDVNSAKATKGADIEDTALRTNLEAADEVARQLRLRDLGGLIVIDFIDMEQPKNQREVENRLKDALRYDRARLQMGKISRFGLMELSRQRLRPALSEGSHTTCPRCNGTGVIRDTDSSALHILRILLEEAMKENTAAIHVQVPVEVAAYLLNEKRSEIHQIENRLNVQIVLIPNIHLETPHYKLERLRQDDNRLEEPKASYSLVDAPATDVGYAQQKSEPKKVRQEAAVKGIIPSQPAPIIAQATQPVKKLGFFSRVIAWFKGEPEVVESPAPTGNTSGQHRGRRDGRYQDRNRQGGRRDRHSQERSSGDRLQQERQVKPPRDLKEERLPQEVNVSPERQKDIEVGSVDAQSRQERGDRRGRGRHQRRGRHGEQSGVNDANVNADDTNTLTNTLTNTSLPSDVSSPIIVDQPVVSNDSNNVSVDAANEGTSRRGRHPRHRRDRQDRAPRANSESPFVEAGVDAVEVGAEVVPVSGALHVASEPDILISPRATSSNQTTISPFGDDLTAKASLKKAEERVSPFIEPANVESVNIEPVKAPIAAPVVESQAVVSESSVVVNTATVASPVSVQPVVSESIPIPQQSSAQVIASQQVAHNAVASQSAARQVPVLGLSRATPAPMPLHELLPQLQEAGLTLVQTDADKLVAAQQSQVPQRVVVLGRVRPPSAPQDNRPMIQVETRAA